jgi:radical SAM superfamily enzyme YgiQ (UPF0313 family)
MEFIGDFFRPPSEAFSRLLQITVGCSHNKCTFCAMYANKKFACRDLTAIETVLQQSHSFVDRRIFLGDGDLLAADYDYLVAVLDLVRKYFPQSARINCYAGPQNLLQKTSEQLRQLRLRKLHTLYLGLESGSDQVLATVKKGVNANQIINGCAKAHAAGFKLSLMVLLGLGGQRLWQEHARQTAAVLNAIQPDILNFLSVKLIPGTALYQQARQGDFLPLTEKQLLSELQLILENLELTRTVVRSDHASNYLPLKGRLGRDKNRLLGLIKAALQGQIPTVPEYLHSL